MTISACTDPQPLRHHGSFRDRKDTDLQGCGVSRHYYGLENSRFYRLDKEMRKQISSERSEFRKSLKKKNSSSIIKGSDKGKQKTNMQTSDLNVSDPLAMYHALQRSIDRLLRSKPKSWARQISELENQQTQLGVNPYV